MDKGKVLFSVTFILIIGFPLFSQNGGSKVEINQAFDFWEGTWEVSWKGKESMEYGKNEIKRILNGKVLQEFFEDGNGRFKGTSITVFDPRKKVWRQAWADSNGDFYNFIGIVSDSTRTFITEEPDSTGNLFQMQFKNITKNDFDWIWSGSKDGGNTWSILWQIRYKRIDE